MKLTDVEDIATLPWTGDSEKDEPLFKMIDTLLVENSSVLLNRTKMNRFLKLAKQHGWGKL